MITLAKPPSDMFSKVFSLTTVAEVYDKDIAWKNIQGIDRISHDQFDRLKSEHFDIILKKCLDGSYNYSPFLEKLRLRGRNRNPRVISIATIRDRIVLSLLKDYLHNIFPECVNRRLPNSYINEIKKFYEATTLKDLCLYKVDIKAFYDNINHTKLLEILAERIKFKPDMVLIKHAIETQTVTSDYRRSNLKEKRNLRGVPQGLAVSNILANIYFHHCDEIFKTNSILYLRYVDDILFVVKNSDQESIKSLVNDKLRELDLSSNKEKTVCIPIHSDIDYLGYHLKLPTVSIKNVTVERYLRSLSALFSAYASRGPTGIYPQVDEQIGKQLFISDLNEKITGAISENKRFGWLFYFLEMNDLPLLYRIDLLIRNKFLNRLKDPKTRPVPEDIKKLSRSYYESKYDPFGGYIHNYDEYDTISKKMQYLVLRGIIKKDGGKTYQSSEIERLFNRFKKKRLSSLEADVGETS